MKKILIFLLSALISLQPFCSQHLHAIGFDDLMKDMFGGAGGPGGPDEDFFKFLEQSGGLKELEAMGMPPMPYEPSYSPSYSPQSTTKATASKQTTASPEVTADRRTLFLNPPAPQREKKEGEKEAEAPKEGEQVIVVIPKMVDAFDYYTEEFLEQLRTVRHQVRSYKVGIDITDLGQFEVNLDKIEPQLAQMQMIERHVRDEDVAKHPYFKLFFQPTYKDLREKIVQTTEILTDVNNKIKSLEASEEDYPEYDEATKTFINHSVKEQAALKQELISVYSQNLSAIAGELEKIASNPEVAKTIEELSKRREEEARTAAQRSSGGGGYDGGGSYSAPWGGFSGGDSSYGGGGYGGFGGGYGGGGYSGGGYGGYDGGYGSSSGGYGGSSYSGGGYSPGRSSGGGYSGGSSNEPTSSTSSSTSPTKAVPKEAPVTVPYRDKRRESRRDEYEVKAEINGLISDLFKIMEEHKEKEDEAVFFVFQDEVLTDLAKQCAELEKSTRSSVTPKKGTDVDIAVQTAQAKTNEELKANVTKLIPYLYKFARFEVTRLKKVANEKLKKAMAEVLPPLAPQEEQEADITNLEKEQITATMLFPIIAKKSLGVDVSSEIRDVLKNAEGKAITQLSNLAKDLKASITVKKLDDFAAASADFLREPCSRDYRELKSKTSTEFNTHLDKIDAVGTEVQAVLEPFYKSLAGMQPHAQDLAQTISVKNDKKLTPEEHATLAALLVNMENEAPIFRTALQQMEKVEDRAELKEKTQKLVGDAKAYLTSTKKILELWPAAPQPEAEVEVESVVTPKQTDRQVKSKKPSTTPSTKVIPVAGKSATKSPDTKKVEPLELEGAVDVSAK